MVVTVVLRLIAGQPIHLFCQSATDCAVLWFERLGECLGDEPIVACAAIKRGCKVRVTGSEP
ncbi:hypothetical protein UU5_16219 [Rhodanobacter sp. 115]|nr:hypothetical protein UU5_16219 [Rhodanobacter sp. 115]